MSQHAQILVASHEQEKFERHLINNFDAESLLTVKVDKFSRAEGPSLVFQ